SRVSYRISSDLPIHAYQHVGFSAADGSSSAAVLLDRMVLGTDYLALAVPGGGVMSRPSVVTIVAPSKTRVPVIPSARVQAGPGVPALPPGVPFSVDLLPYDVLQLGSDPAGGDDLTGTTISADAPVEVFVGCSECTLHGSSADLVQEFMFPMPWWGTS